MQQYLLSYFKAEKKECFFLLGLGCIALGVSALGFFYFRSDFSWALATPFALFAIPQLIISISGFLRIDQQLKILLNQLENAPSNYFLEERSRMEKIIANYTRFKNVLLLLFILGFFFVIMGGLANWGEITLGIGIGLTIQSALMLIIDLVADWRSSMYAHKLEQFQSQF